MARTLDWAAPPTHPLQTHRSRMKLLTCIIRPEKLEDVKEGIRHLNLIGGVTVTDVRGFGRQKGSTEHYKGIAYRIRFLDKIKLELVIADDDVPAVEATIARLARTGKIGDGKIFVSTVWNARRIRTGEQGVDAL